MPLAPSPDAMAFTASVTGMPVNVTTPVALLYVAVAPAGRLPNVTPLRPVASVSV